MSDAPERETPAVAAAVSVASEAGYLVGEPCVLADSNHTIVWLRPHQVIAKVGRPSADGLLVSEHRISAALAELGAPVAAPVPGVEPTREATTGLLVTLWHRLELADGANADPADVGASLRAVHEALDLYEGELPSFLHKLESARALLFDDGGRMSALRVDDRRFLRAAFDALLGELDSRQYTTQCLHGEPHGGNRLVTATGMRWIDFEGACVGPLEWDLAFLTPPCLSPFRQPDNSLLELLRTLISARTATLCWERYDVPALRWHAEFHLEQVRRRTPRSRATTRAM